MNTRAWKALPSETETILLALATPATTGAVIGDRFAKLTGRTISPGTLYSTLRRMRAVGWLGDEPGPDERSSVYRMRPRGRRALRASANRHAQLAAIAGGRDPASWEYAVNARTAQLVAIDGSR